MWCQCPDAQVNILLSKLMPGGSTAGLTASPLGSSNILAAMGITDSLLQAQPNVGWT